LLRSDQVELAHPDTDHLTGFVVFRRDVFEGTSGMLGRLGEPLELVHARARHVGHRLVEMCCDTDIAELPGIRNPHALAFQQRDWGSQASGKIALQGGKERRHRKVRCTCGAKEEPQTFRRGRVFHDAVAVAKLCRHGNVIAGRDDSGKPESALFTTAAARLEQAQPLRQGRFVYSLC
jgi:hypothetical protein